MENNVVGKEPIFAVSDAVAVLNQTLEMIYPTMTIVGELANYKIAKGRWVYGDLKDDNAKLRLFGTIYQLPGPLEEGMMLEITAEPRLHPQFGFSLNIQSIRPIGEGSIKKAAHLLQAKLEAEGLFAKERKRLIPHTPSKIGLIASAESAGYADFIKIMQARWLDVEVHVYDAQVQGESAPESIIAGLQYFNQHTNDIEVLVVVRGGGSADDLQAFSTEQVVRAVAASRIPTVVAIGHEVDVSLAELAADLRASTPSNAAELLFPDKDQELKRLKMKSVSLQDSVLNKIDAKKTLLTQMKTSLAQTVDHVIVQKTDSLVHARKLLNNMHPKASLKRGFALVQKNDKLVSSVTGLKPNDTLKITFQDGDISSNVERLY